jgi:hypothetical protein
MRSITRDTNRKMARDGMFSLELLEQLQVYIDEFRNGEARNGPGGAPE